MRSSIQSYVYLELLIKKCNDNFLAITAHLLSYKALSLHWYKFDKNIIYERKLKKNQEILRYRKILPTFLYRMFTYF